MRILLIAYYYPPMNSSGMLRPLAMAKYLPLEGHDVHVLTAHSGSPKLIVKGNTLRVRDNLLAFFTKKPFYNLFKIPYYLFQRAALCCGKYESVRINWLENVKKESGKIMQIANPDIILCTYPPVETFELGLFFLKSYSIPLVSDFRDGLIFEPIEKNRIHNSIVYKNYKNIEEDICNNSKAIFTVSDPISDYISSTYAQKNVYTIPNGYEEITATFQSVQKFDKSKFHIVHTGRFSLSDSGTDLSQFLEVINDLITNHTHVRNTLCLHLAGELSFKEKLQLRKLIKEGIVIYYGKVSREKSLALQNAADLLLIVTSIKRKSVATGKLFEYLHTGKPILALTSGTYCEKIIQDTQAGWSIHPHDKVAQRELLLQLLSGRKKKNTLFRNEILIGKYSRRSQMREVSEILNTVL